MEAWQPTRCKAARLVGDEPEAVRILDRLQSLAVRDGTVAEICGGGPAPRALRSLLYRAEERLARADDGRYAYRLRRPTPTGATSLVLTTGQLVRTLAALVLE